MDWSDLAYFAFVAAVVILMMRGCGGGMCGRAIEVATIRQATNSVVMITLGRRHRSRERVVRAT